jgi:hypothetical protein
MDKLKEMIMEQQRISRREINPRTNPHRGAKTGLEMNK